MSTRFNCADADEFRAGIHAAAAAVGRGELVVAPTDTVYGICADAFSPAAVQRLLTAKGRTRQAPPPVLIADPTALDALAIDVAAPVRHLVDAFWPGGLTIVVRARPEVSWDLGETHGTVGLRVPDSASMRSMLEVTGPLAVSSANRTGMPSATTIDAADRMLGDAVSIYLDDGPVAPHAGHAVATASTIVDATTFAQTGSMRIIRHGVITATALARTAGAIFTD